MATNLERVNLDVLVSTLMTPPLGVAHILQLGMVPKLTRPGNYLGTGETAKLTRTTLVVAAKLTRTT